MRLANSTKNLKYNFLALIANLLIQFVGRTVFIWVLGKEYLGLDGLLSNILTILSLADMGIGTVLVHALYAPLARKDYMEIKQLVGAYKKIYEVIASVIFCFGICVIPFLPYFVGEASSIPDIVLIYMLYLMNTVVSYLFSYKISIINADQKNYLVTINRQIFLMISNLVMTMILVITKSFIGYLVVQIIFTLLANLRISRVANDLYPFLKERIAKKLPMVKKRQIYKGATAMILHKVGGVVVSGTDNLLMSLMIGLDAVGVYSNYLLITTAVRRVTDVYSTSIVASIGNLGTEGKLDKMHVIFKRVYYGGFMMTAFCTTCLFCLLSPFIKLWLGDGFIFNIAITAAIAASFYISGMRQSVLCFIEALGLFTKNRVTPVIEVICNFVLSVVLTWKFGVIGIILGTALSQLLVCTFWEAFVVYRYGLKKEMQEFIYKYIKFMLIAVVNAVLVFFLSNIFIPQESVIGFVFRAIFVVLLSAVLLVACTFYSDEFSYFIGFLRSKILRR